MAKQMIQKTEKKETGIRVAFLVRSALLLLVVVIVVTLAIPFLFSLTLSQEQTYSFTPDGQFPVTVDPRNRVIAENAKVNEYLTSPDSPLMASAWGLGSVIRESFAFLATTISNAPWYAGIASVEGRLVTITPGMRKEQAAMVFGNVLSWSDKQKKEFMTAPATESLPFIEGSFSPGTYLLSSGMTPKEAQELVNERFTRDVLSHYGTTTAAIVPLDDAINIAALIQRETIGTNDMRLVSGVIWNRLFLGMRLQVDATLQYAKANTKTATSWWPKVVPTDARRRSPYNTYLNQGLPPAPIANPSVAAILAALNPLETSCLFYFNDEAGDILCTDTYEQHVALLKKYYGRGK